MASLHQKDVIRLYRHLVRLCHSFDSNASLMVRDIAECTPNVWLPYDVRDFGTRAVMNCLKKHAHVTDISENPATGEIEAALYDLPAPILPESMVLTRKDMLHYLRRNFDAGKQQVEDAPREEREDVEQATVARGIVLGDFLHWQMLLHRMSSVRTVCFQGLLPPEEDTAHSTGSQDGGKRRQSSARFSMESEHAADLASAPGRDTAATSSTGTAAPAGVQSSSNASTSEADSQHEEEDQAQRSLRRGRELRDVQIELDRVNKLYKRKSPLVLDANQFEALCMSNSAGSTGASGGGESIGQHGTEAEAESGIAHNGLELRQAKLRVNAVPFPVEPKENRTGLIIQSDRMLFYYQILIENVGDTAVQLLGRFHEMACPWNVIRYGNREEPRGHRTDGPVLLPGSVMLEQQYAVMDAFEGTLKGGFLCRLLPLEVAKKLDRLTGCKEIVKNEALVMKSFDPDCHFVAEIGEMKIKRLDEKPFSDRAFASVGGYDSDDERENDHMVHGEYADDSGEYEDDSDVDSDQELGTRNND